MIRVEYEILPLRAIYVAEFEDDGQTDQEIRDTLADCEPTWRIHKITRQPNQDAEGGV